MRRILLAAGIAVLAASAPASAATIGTTSVASLTCGADLFVWDTDAAFSVPAGGGVITSMAFNAAAAGGTLSLKIVRAVGNSGTVVATTPLFTAAAGGNRIPMHVPVQGGEFLGLYSGDGAADCGLATPGSVVYKDPAGGDPGVGATVVADTPQSAQLAIQATFEPDADHDGFGDETEDSCPADASIHTGSCQVDVGVTQSVVPATIGVGDVAVATVTLSNGSAGTARGLALGATLTPGLQLLSTIPSAGCAFTPALSCPLGTLAGGATTVAALVVKGTAVGRQTVTSGASSTPTDPNAANNTAASTVTVERRAPVVCTVPKLVGLTKAFAKQLLAAVNCKLGKVTSKKSATGKKGTVIKQAKKPKTVLRAGSTVAVTLKK